ncbi:HotDog domain-containing protein [Xylogone sp. PMI_703]|nr:HotDog domain-containing protein [Xylogone sp. PMI_703]
MISRIPLQAAQVRRNALRIASKVNGRLPVLQQAQMTWAFQKSQLHQLQFSRKYSSPTNPTTPSSFPVPESEPPRAKDLRSQLSSSSQGPSPPNQKPKRSIRIYIYAAVFFIIGMSAGQYVRMVIAPPELPQPDTPADRAMVKYLQKQAEELPLVKALSSDPEWESWPAYQSLSFEERGPRLTTGALGGARGIGAYQTVFRNKSTGECITVVWIGGAMSGWPGVVHGGLVATLLDEGLGRCAIAMFPSKTGVTANLELNYERPTLTNGFYVIRAKPREGATERKAWIDGSLETMDGKVLVRSKALYVVPKKVPNLKVHEVGF